MVDKRDVYEDKLDYEQNRKQGKMDESIGEHPAHAPQPGRKTPQIDMIDEDAIDESGNLIHDDGKDENDAK
jgi:hypothetical protein